MCRQSGPDAAWAEGIWDETALCDRWAMPVTGYLERRLPIGTIVATLVSEDDGQQRWSTGTPTGYTPEDEARANHRGR